MSQWPEPTSDPSEPPRWPGFAALGAVVFGGALLAAGDSDWIGSLQRSWRMPEISIPDIDIALPDLDLRGRSETPGETAPVGEVASISGSAAEVGAPVVQQSVPYEACVTTIADTANSVDQQPILLEDTQERRVAVFKFQSGDLTVTCSRTDETMTIQQRGS